MKTLMTLLLMCGLYSPAHGSLKMEIPVNDVFVPDGYDINDPGLEIVVRTVLPNLCYQGPRVEKVVNGNKISLKVVATMYEDSERAGCSQISLPMSHVETVKMKMLEKGRYTVSANGVERDFVIKESESDAVDDYLYANVENVIKKIGSREVTLVGYNPNSCYDLDEVKVYSNGKNAYSVLPVMKRVSELCPMRITPFSYTFQVPEDLNSKSEVLLHIRSMGGNSHNVIFSNIMARLNEGDY